MSLTSRLQALLTFANEKTEAGDTTIGAAIKTLAEGYSGDSGSATYPTITDADTLSSRIQALIAYADETTGEGDATLAEAIKRLCDGYNTTPQWMIDAAETYGLEIANLKQAMQDYTFVDYLESSGTQYINTGIQPWGYSCFLDFKYMDTQNGIPLFGSQDGGNKAGLYLNKTGTSSTWNNICGNSFGLSIDFSDWIKFIYNYDGKNGITGYYKFVANGVSSNDYVLSNAYTSNTYPIYLFAYDRANSVRYYLIEQIRSFRVTTPSAGTVMVLLPAISADGTYGMLDIVDMTFYENLGSGNFIVPTDTSGNIIEVSLESKFEALFDTAS